MPPRTSPTERQKRLGAEVRRLRTSAGMTAEAAAGLLGLDRAKVSNIESGIRSVNAERLRTLAYNCDCHDTAYIEALVAMSDRSGRGWWERYRGSLPAGLLDIAELEHHAGRIRTGTVVHVPGLLQTSDYATALFRMGAPALPEHEVALRVAHRLERQQILDRAAPTELVAVIHEAALRMQFGGRKVVRAQLDHLAARSEHDNVTLLVIAFANGTFPGAGQTVNYLHGPVPQLDTVQSDNAHGAEFLHQDAQLSKYRAQLDFMERLALPATESRDFLLTMANEL